MRDAILIYLGVINIIAFGTFGLDKMKAKRNHFRIPEKVLLGLAAAGGSIGAFIGMRVFRHKTQKSKFYLGVPVIFLIQITVVIYLLVNH